MSRHRPGPRDPGGESLLAAVARASRAADALPGLHRRALDVTGGNCSLLLEHNPRVAAFQVTSGRGIDALRTDLWTPSPQERQVLNGCFHGRAPKMVADARKRVPDVVARMRPGIRSVLLLPVSHGRHRLGILAVGFPVAPGAPLRKGDAMDVADAFVAALELLHLRQKNEQEKAIRALQNEFSSTLGATLNLTAGLDIFSHGAKRLFGAHRATIWLHDRQHRQLVIEASSEPQHQPRGVRVNADDAAAPAAAAMRRTRPEIVAMPDDPATGMMTIPLRGWRRALGTIVLEGLQVEAGDESDLIDRCGELGRQLSTSIEGMQLLKAMIGSNVKSAPPKLGSALSEAERERIRRHSAQSERLPALGVFVAGIAHELNNPLQGVLGHLELLRATGTFPKHLQRELQTIYREADRAAKIVRNLLVFTGARRLSRRRVSLNAVLQKVVALRIEACRSLNIEIVRHYGEKLPRVQSDPLLLHQVFLNMVMNAEQAIAASGRPGRIELTTKTIDEGRRVVTTVRDTGDGIPPDDLGRIFEPFYTTKEVGKGTGLGLAIAYGIVNEHGGRISAANAPGGGAIFMVELPAIQQPSSEA